MSSEITDLDFFAYAGEVPWHGLGQKFDELFTFEKALILDERLASEIIQREVYFKLDDGTYQVIPERFANVRSFDNQFVGIVSDHYTVVQWSDICRILADAIREIGIEPMFETGGSIRTGREQFLLARLPEPLDLKVTWKGKTTNDRLINYLLANNAHDGTGGFDVFPTDVRVVCNNTLNLARDTSDARFKIGFSHIGDLEEHFEAVKAMLLEALRYHKLFAELAPKLIETSVTNETIAEFLAQLFPPIEVELTTRPGEIFRLSEIPEGVPVPESARKADAHRDRRVEAWENVYAAEMDRFGPTLYSVLNASTGYADHQRPFATRKAGVGKFASAISGDGHLIKHRALEIVARAIDPSNSLLVGDLVGV